MNGHHKHAPTANLTLDPQTPPTPDVSMHHSYSSKGQAAFAFVSVGGSGQQHILLQFHTNHKGAGGNTWKWQR